MTVNKDRSCALCDHNDVCKYYQKIFEVKRFTDYVKLEDDKRNEWIWSFANHCFCFKEMDDS